MKDVCVCGSGSVHVWVCMYCRCVCVSVSVSVCVCVCVRELFLSFQPDDAIASPAKSFVTLPTCVNLNLSEAEHAHSYPITDIF